MKNEDLINKFNTMFPVGSKVRWRSVGNDGVPYEVLTVLGAAALLSGHSPVAWFRERVGCCSIEERFVDYALVEVEQPYRATPEDAKRFADANRVEGGDGWQLMADFAKATISVPMTEAEQYSRCGKCGECAYCKAVRSHIRDIREHAKPLDIIIHCPNCKMQHIDKPEPDICKCGHSVDYHYTEEALEKNSDPRKCFAMPHSADANLDCKCEGFEIAWNNDPHKSHLCKPADGGCGHKFRVADVPTNGVAEIKTRGENDTWPEVK